MPTPNVIMIHYVVWEMKQFDLPVLCMEAKNVTVSYRTYFVYRYFKFQLSRCCGSSYILLVGGKEYGFQVTDTMLF